MAATLFEHTSWEKVMFEVTGLFGLIVLALDIWALINVVQSGASTGTKVVWALVIIILPILGFVAWLLFGPRSGRSVRA